MFVSSIINLGFLSAHLFLRQSDAQSHIFSFSRARSIHSISLAEHRTLPLFPQAWPGRISNTSIFFKLRTEHTSNNCHFSSNSSFWLIFAQLLWCFLQWIYEFLEFICLAAHTDSESMDSQYINDTLDFHLFLTATIINFMRSCFFLHLLFFLSIGALIVHCEILWPDVPHPLRLMQDHACVMLCETIECCVKRGSERYHVQKLSRSKH